MEHSGPDISFVATFPQAGLYKIFVQFQHEGNVLATDFVVEVKSALSAQRIESRRLFFGKRCALCYTQHHGRTR